MFQNLTDNIAINNKDVKENKKYNWYILYNQRVKKKENI